MNSESSGKDNNKCYEKSKTEPSESMESGAISGGGGGMEIALVRRILLAVRDVKAETWKDKQELEGQTRRRETGEKSFLIRKNNV